MQTVVQIHTLEETKGDILLFLTGMQEIEDACEKIRNEVKGIPEAGTTYHATRSCHATRPF